MGRDDSTHDLPRHGTAPLKSLPLMLGSGSCSFLFFASQPRQHRRGERPFAPLRPHGHPLACGTHLVADALRETGETRHESCIVLC
jgi:hypothetical protein